eukprot:CAMPEP_0176456272 /NCGR_PEP_ID=MMETSP0127-20121128/31182_1 /TAXON_ID=938130 /ORGANISM="Platyophrya macrostoma, Strain WH" /LENGTH=239 /DNA_ID=CAMNT_0017846185 /DNA_START=7 /DNA_END=726 /DNA_ORIENTATION=+
MTDVVPTSEKPGVFKKLHFNQNKSAVVVEFIGTFLFVLTIPLSLISNEEVAPLAIGMMLCSMIFTFGYISGGHFNPMVSFSVFLCSKEFTKVKLIVYVIAQMAGAVAAVFYCVLINGTDFPTPNPGLDFWNMFRAFMAESVYTFVLSSVVLHVACSKQKNNNFYGFAIGFAVLSGSLTVYSISGAAFNPAVATALIVVRCLTLYCEAMASLWVYWGSEIVGSIMAAVMYLAVLNVDEQF